MNGRVINDIALVLSEQDTVATALEDLSDGSGIEWDGNDIEISEDIPFGHKFALEPIERGVKIRKYGEVIGQATQFVASGEWVHTHNCESTRGRGDLTAQPEGQKYE